MALRRKVPHKVHKVPRSRLSFVPGVILSRSVAAGAFMTPPDNPPRLEIVNRDGSLIAPIQPLCGQNAIATLAGHPLQPNRGTSLNLDLIESVRVNTSAVERRAATLVTRRTVKKDWQIAWLLRAATCIDLTTLSGDDTDERVKRLCAKARQPISLEIMEKLGIGELGIQVGAVCVYHLFVETARRALE